ncbi:amidohydrolase family protein [Balneolaceae bacterium YR4-1]|uniref:Amidohydrolase family protein n=1 Tax=Halalkalibaculum roseum TaxID=2709311 RepID=A0A6M1SR81_9BACT|nr:amidohydrolase family protein [Halalkalibaculum roseum]NGP77921.1 amidohydrolase family protein [Halalkalibaculum roseum]
MKYFISLFSLLFILIFQCTAQRTAFTDITVIPMTGDELLENYTVIVEGDRILEVGPAQDISVNEETTVINGNGKFLMPGLAEMHGHVPPTDPPANAPSYFTDQYVEHTLFLYVAAGITTVRGMLGWPNQLELKEKVNNGEMIGPNLYLAGPSFNGNSIDSPRQAREKVKTQSEEGWDLLKIHPGLTRAEYDAMAETANSLDIRFGGHVPEDVGIEHALEMGQETMDHIDGYYRWLQQYEQPEWESRMQQIISKTIEAEVWIVPTQALWETVIGAADFEAMQQYDELKYIPTALRKNYFGYASRQMEEQTESEREQALKEAEWRRKLLAEMNRRNVRILMGTDAPQLFSVPGFSIHRELPHMEAAGMSPYEILKSGTVNVGEYFKNEDTFGTVAKGQRADLLLLNANPLNDLDHLKNHAGVMVQGRWYSREMIDAKLKEIEQTYSE